ncbi:UDP-N-acetylmuramate--L-alanine ligase [Mechercharimyces sp. CAU 1602]|uniref:UDP-N-acetylmuramate--L-alanine ligase n=1 Tax=Mechercharimyces sp. CAU 1602 TaxID=2973933 RepID=UPI002163D558|nr:UDP-N-acetylmuramate--L-alanine ligase [Mechercharimyces sp. CAU 1602]MCS1351449.1 UDP-N-acetylmuramate--L-alanine ligase [Mechercharimyces sp. CAU 1602]
MKANEHIHFIGIGGYGMSAIARVLVEMGHPVTGSDLSANKLTESLAARGATVHYKHDAKWVEGADRVVYSSSIPEHNVEMMAAREWGIPVMHRSEMLALLLNDKQGIAVAGAHGKTTTSSMIAQVMELGEADPTYIIGGEVVGLDGNAKAGSSPYVVAEADESDGTFLEYFPYIGIVTNIEPDHLENYDGDFKNLKQAYKQFLSQIQSEGSAILSVDDPYLREMKEEVDANVITYGLHPEADYRAINIRAQEREVRFEIQYRGEVLGEIHLFVPGHHNVSNALAAVITCLQVGLSFAQIADALTHFRGAKRRFQVIGEVNGIMVVDDYAHHPTEIRSTIEGVKAMNKRIVTVFQPQRYSRTHLLMQEFSEAFADADEVVITSIYSPAGEKPIEGVTSERLTQMVKESGQLNVQFCNTQEEAKAYLLEMLRQDDLVLTMGAGDIWQLAHSLVPALEKREA